MDYKWSGELTITDLQNATYPHPYETSCFIKADELGNLPAGWYFIKYYKHVHSDGFGHQEAIALNGKEKYQRGSNGIFWREWSGIATDGSVYLTDCNNTINPIACFDINTINRPSFMNDGTILTGKWLSSGHVFFQLAFGIGTDNLPKIGVRFCNVTWSEWLEK